MGGSGSTTGQDPSLDLTGVISDTARALFSAGGVGATLRRLLDLTIATVDGCDFAGIFLLESGTITTDYQTDPVVAEVDNIQIAIGEGPCVSAITEGMIFYADDLVEDAVWPRFAHEATTRGMRSLLALPLLAGDRRGALNLYAKFPRAFGSVDRAKAVVLATLAGLALSSAHAHEDEARHSAELRTALATRELIGQAQGILMERERITAEQAFDVLRRASQHLNRKLREIAQDLVDTGQRPETASPPRGSPRTQISPGE